MHDSSKNLAKANAVCSTLTRQYPSFLWELFHVKENSYNLKSKNLLELPQTKESTYAIDSLSFRGIKVAASVYQALCKNIGMGRIVYVRYVNRTFSEFVTVIIYEH